MRTAHTLTVSPSMLCRGVSAPRGVCSGGCLLPGVCSGGCLLPGEWLLPERVSAPGGCLLGGCGIPVCTEADTPTVNRITHACEKHNPCPNFVAGGKYLFQKVGKNSTLSTLNITLNSVVNHFQTYSSGGTFLQLSAKMLSNNMFTFPALRLAPSSGKSWIRHWWGFGRTEVGKWSCSWPSLLTFQFTETGMHQMVHMCNFAGRSFLGLGSLLTGAKVRFLSRNCARTWSYVRKTKIKKIFVNKIGFFILRK